MYVNLIDKLDDQVVATLPQAEIKKALTLYPTEASVKWISPSGRVVVEGSCLRAVWYRLMKERKTNPANARLHFVWKFGEHWEEDCKQLLKEKGELVQDHARFLDTSFAIPLSGEIDAICIDKEKSPHEFYIVEFKTTGGSYIARTKLMGNRAHRPEPKVENLLQLMLYLAQTRESVSYGILAYLIRDKMERCQFLVRLEDHEGQTVARVSPGCTQLEYGTLCPQYSMENIYHRYREVIGFFQRKELPPRDYSLVYSEDEVLGLMKDGELSKKQVDEHLGGKDMKGAWQCSYCSYQSKCYSPSGSV